MTRLVEKKKEESKDFEKDVHKDPKYACKL